MWRYVFIAISMAAFASELPSIMDAVKHQPQAGAKSPATVAKLEASPTSKKPATKRLTGRKTRIEMNTHGQFIADARLNGRRMKVLVDTGATSVAINQSTARRIGIRLKPSDFRYKARTANGTTEIAITVIDEIRVGRIIVKNVQASVSRDSSLSFVLLGMSFLRQLKKFEVADATLILTQ